MSAGSIRPLKVILIALALSACASPGPAAAAENAAAPPIGVDLGSSTHDPALRSGAAAARPGEGHEKTAPLSGGMRAAGHRAAHASRNAIRPTGSTSRPPSGINLSPRSDGQP